MDNRLRLLLVGAIVVAVAVGGTWYLWKGERQAVLSTDSLERQEQLGALLSKSGMAFEHDDENRVTVRSEDVQLARALADEASLTLPERNGFEIFENEDYGATEFVQRINYQRALQAELERTIVRISGVRNARVHVLQPARSTFFRRDNVSRASVFLELEREVPLSAVAPSVGEILLGAVEGLEIDDVKIISGRGDVLAAAGSEFGGGLTGQTPEYSMERRLTETIYAVLRPLYDPSSIGVSVSVELDRSTRNIQRRNTPLVAEGTANSESMTEDVTVPPGEVRRIGVGVMLPQPISVEDAGEIERLLRSGLGISSERGDVLAVMPYWPTDSMEEGMSELSAFAQPLLPVQSAGSPAPSPSPPLSQTQWNWILLITLAAMLGLLTIYRVMQRRQRRSILEQVSGWVHAEAAGRE